MTAIDGWCMPPYPISDCKEPVMKMLMRFMIPLRQIKKTLTACDSPRKSAELLVDAALRKGGKDNVTAIVVHLLYI